MTTATIEKTKTEGIGLEPFIDALMGASNLNVNQAKTLSYYALTTWSDMPKIRPIIDLNGESGTVAYSGEIGRLFGMKPAGCLEQIGHPL